MNKLVVLFESASETPLDVHQTLIFNNELDMVEYFSSKEFTVKGHGNVEHEESLKLASKGGIQFFAKVYWAKEY